MALNELEILSIEKLLALNLKIPEYQRPYRWSIESTNTLFNDIYKAFKTKGEEYRIGTVILNKEKDKYNIVDGQQRLTTIAILLYCCEKNIGLLGENYSPLSNDAIVNNHCILKKRVNELGKEKNDFKNHILEKCTMVKIVTDNQQEAFQFFDSQNSRGKSLEPHDLLKAYHLREMNDDSVQQKKDVVQGWEEHNSASLSELFKEYLYPIMQWYKGKNGFGYSDKEIGSFKGIKTENTYNHAIYHKSSNLFVEQFNSNGNTELLNAKTLNQFQLTQPILAGKRFFKHIQHYMVLLDNVRNRIDDFHKDTPLPDYRSGDKYTKRLYECVLLFFADKFGIDSLQSYAMQQLYTWAYSLRISMTAVYEQSINKYALGSRDLNNEINMFTRISEMNEPEEIKIILLDKPELPNVKDGAKIKDEYKIILDKICDYNNWR